MDAFQLMMTEEVVQEAKMLNEAKLNEGKNIRLEDPSFQEIIGMTLESVLNEKMPDSFWDDGRYLLDVEVTKGGRPGDTEIGFLVMTIDEKDDEDSQIDVEVTIDFLKGAKVKARK
jgi:hypothetical protein